MYTDRYVHGHTHTHIKKMQTEKDGLMRKLVLAYLSMSQQEKCFIFFQKLGSKLVTASQLIVILPQSPDCWDHRHDKADLD